jgi:hypothetical protein
MWWTALAFGADSRDLIAPLGVDRLSEVGELTFTFNVAKEGQDKPRPGRAWRWRPADNTVTRTIEGQSLTFTFGAPQTPEEEKADAQFVNDSFWLLPQLHVRWAGPDLVVTDKGEASSPMPGGGSARLVTLQYSASGGGYTPGDAYDLFLDPQGRILAWNYREKGATEPTMTTSFSEYVTVGPLQVATDHRSPDGSFRLFFTDVTVTGRAP